MVVMPRKLGLYWLLLTKSESIILRNVHTLQRKEVHKKGAKEIFFFVLFKTALCNESRCDV